MANFDIKHDTVPTNPLAKPRGPKISDLRTALSTFNSTSYSTDRLNQMSEGDMVYACQVHSLTVAGV